MIVKFKPKDGHLTGKDIINFIRENHLEDRTLYRTNSEDTEMRVYSIECDDSEDSTTFLVD